MLARLKTVWFCAVLFVALGARAGVAAEFEKDIRPLVQTYCVSCHNAETTRGDLDLQRFETNATVLESVAVWERIAKRLEAKEMPPRKAQQQPTDAERQALMEWIGSLEADNVDCTQIATEESVSWYPGYVMSRRLNRVEYENTLRDLLGIELNVAHLFPADGAGGEGFDNNGNALFLSAIQVEKYLAAADLAVETALPKQRADWSPTMAALLGGIGPNDHAEIEKPLRAFAERAWRRPLTDEEVARLVATYGKRKRHGRYDAIKFVFKSVLVSPNFVFLAEPEPEQPGNYELGGFPLAARLSYFLWSSMPDDELFAVARDGKLRDTQVLLAQTRRMLVDPKSKALGNQFAAQWLGITQLGETIKPDAQRFPEFNDTMAVAMRNEAATFFHHVVANNRSLLELIDADYTFANQQLAAIYGLADITGEDFREVKLADNTRGGVLGMAAVLTTTSQPLRTSPVLRGKWVLEQLLGDRVPPPPPNVPQLPADDKPEGGLTMRARLEAHRENPDCASCHARMDPIGFGLENFDPIGRWRTETGGAPVDSKGVLPSGEAFDGPRELKAILMSRKEDFTKNLARKMLGYALGRSLTKYDECVVTAGVEAVKAQEYRPLSLFEEIVLSYPFRHRYAGRSDAGDNDA